jgi:hypothetical protein
LHPLSQHTEKKGKFSLSTAEEFFAKRKGQEPAVVPGAADESLLVDLITPHNGAEPEMPEEGHPLSAEEIGVIRRWIAEGASWPDGVVVRSKPKADRATWWSLQPLREVPPPEVPGAPEAWTRDPIDRFIFAGLSAKGLSPSSPAAPRDLIRRATFDLTGLPPSPEEVEQFAADCARDEQQEKAYAALIDRLLASPRYGERWGRHWLDVVRFGESSGFERNVIREDAWPFRDYVIASLNADKPFDQFIMEHLAGDQLAAGDPWVEIGSAFLVAGPYDDVGIRTQKRRADPGKHAR